MALQLYTLPFPTSSKSKCFNPHTTTTINYHPKQLLPLSRRGRRISGGRGFDISAIDNNELLFGVQEDTEQDDDEDEDEEEEDDDESPPPTPQDIEHVAQIKRVLQLLKKNRDMVFSEVKLTIMIEDPREVERRRFFGIDDADAPTRDDLAATLEEVHQGKIPKDRIALQLLAEEMSNWPNLEVEIEKTKRTKKSLYAKATDTGIDPQVAAKRLNIDWDTAAEINDAVVSDESEVPPALGYGALYLVSGFPIIIGVSVVLILFYNSLQ